MARMYKEETCGSCFFCAGACNIVVLCSSVRALNCCARTDSAQTKAVHAVAKPSCVFLEFWS